MNALVRKELRQVLPAHALLAALFALAWWVTTTPEVLVAPDVGDLRARHLLLAGVYLVEGLVLGFAQFGGERWNGTEAYLVHRGTGTGGAFAAKLSAGLAALALLVVAPPALWLAAQLATGGWIEGAPLAHLGHALVASTTCLGGWAVGVFATQLRGGWPGRVMFALLGGCTVLYVAKVAAEAIEPLGQASALRFVGAQVVLAAAVLAVAFGLFRAGEDAARTWPPLTAAAFAVVALELFTAPYVIGPMAATKALRNGVVEGGPRVVQDRAGALYLARETEWRRYALRDAEGRALPEDVARTYDGWGRVGDPFHTLYRPLSTPLAWTERPDDALEPRPARPWIFEPVLRRVLTTAGDAWYDVERGRLGAVVRDPDGRRARWVELDVPARMGLCYPTRPFDEARRPPLFVDVAEGRLWSLVTERGQAPRLVERHLPDGDRVRGVRRVQSELRLRAGMFEPLGTSDGLVVLGERGPYTWLGDGIALTADVAPDQLDGLEPSGGVASDGLQFAAVDVDGLGYRLEVRDAATGRVRIEADYRARGLGAVVFHLATLASAPAAAVVSWSRAPIPPTEADRASASPLADPLLRGRSRPLLLLAVLAIGALLAHSVWRRLGRAGVHALPRAMWTVGTLCFGLSAWFLAQFLAGGARPGTARTRPEPNARRELEIVTA